MKTTVKDIAEFYDEHPEFIGKIKVDTRFGFKTIQYADVTAHNSEVYEIVTDKEKRIFASPDHRLFNKKWVRVKNLNVGDNIQTIDGNETISICNKLPGVREDLYDLQVEDVKEYYANGFVSHNSTVAESLSFVLYGKPLRKINKSQLINSINQKNLLVELELETFGSQYLIRRGMKPNVFEIFKDGDMLEQDAAVKDQQQFLEENILKIDHKSFNQIVMLGTAKYTPFMQLDAASRRDVIEDLLDIKVFGVMNSILKERASTNKSDIIQNKADIEVLEVKIESAKKQCDMLSMMKKEESDRLKTKLAETTAEYEQELSKKKELSDRLEEQEGLHSAAISTKRKIENVKSIERDLRFKISSIEDEMSFYEKHDNCPTCRQAIERAFKKTIVEEKTEKREEIFAAINSLGEKLSILSQADEENLKIEKKIRECELSLGETVAKIKMLKSRMIGLSEEITKIEKSEDDSNVASILSEIEALETSLENKKEERQRLSDEKETIAVLALMLKDGGIKSRIIKQYIPVINTMINKYLSDFELFVDFHLDENFNETIKSRHRDTFSYDSFSEGEKLRIDLSILFTWRALAKMKNSISTNLLFLDEILDSGTDAEGIEALIDILNRQKSDDNIFIISHRGHLFQDKVPNVIRFEKNKNFSCMIED